MHLIIFFQRPQITSPVLAILFTSHLALAACDEYFHLSRNPGDAKVQNKGDGFWYRCVSSITDKFNDHRAICKKV
ncbi:hypothetical protein PSHT_06272 [Puccinia striiformis]|uniref:Secreted protein n=1 Tax=Puccinia striiformis TaxID=27350 RepID=A0A2S4W7Q1_9BASI|nr:hypothetical protein PSHT_06272 [Puccinia striiformis]